MDEANLTPGQTISPQQPEEPKETKKPVKVDVPAEAVATTDSDSEFDDYAEDASRTINWTASEFVAHEKTIGWYLVLSLVAIIIAALIYLVTKDIISVGVVILSAFFLGMFAARKPRQLEYQIDPDGINIGDKRYFYDDFRSFGIIPEGPFSSIVFMPHKRFAVPISIYYPPDQEDNIANLIGQQLPIEEHKHDAVDRLMRSIRF